MAAAAPYIMIAAAVASAASAYQAGQTQKKASEYNAQVATMEADQQRQAGAANAADAMYKARLLLGTQKAAAAASGVDPGTGSPLEIASDTAARTTLDALRIKYGADVKGTFLDNQAGQDRFMAGRYNTASYMGAGASLLNGLALYGARQNVGGTTTTATTDNPTG
jgi:hypothetical protein